MKTGDSINENEKQRHRLVKLKFFFGIIIILFTCLWACVERIITGRHGIMLENKYLYMYNVCTLL